MSLHDKLRKLWGWFKKSFMNVVLHADNVAISVTEHVKIAMDSGVVGFLAEVIGKLTGSGLPVELVTVIRLNLPRVLAAELALQHLSPNPTEEEILDFEQRVLEAFNVHNQKSKLYTVLAAQVYGIIKTHINEAHATTFADWVQIVEESYVAYLADKESLDND